MAGWDDLLKGDMSKGLAVGVGAALLAPVVLPAAAGLGRPVARAAMKAGIVVYEKGRETVAEFGEVVDDLVAEARAELAHQGEAQQVEGQVENKEQTLSGSEQAEHGVSS